jgi:serine/threonine-protein phosphatase 2B catalytic subunit
MDPETEPNQAEERRNQQVDNAIRAIQEKKPVPEIDFTLHTMEDGTQVSTMERVCKGASDVTTLYPTIADLPPSRQGN